MAVTNIAHFHSQSPSPRCPFDQHCSNNCSLALTHVVHLRRRWCPFFNIFLIAQQDFFLSLLWCSWNDLIMFAPNANKTSFIWEDLDVPFSTQQEFFFLSCGAAALIWSCLPLMQKRQVWNTWVSKIFLWELWERGSASFSNENHLQVSQMTAH